MNLLLTVATKKLEMVWEIYVTTTEYSVRMFHPKSIPKTCSFSGTEFPKMNCNRNRIAIRELKETVSRLRDVEHRDVEHQILNLVEITDQDLLLSQIEIQTAHQIEMEIVLDLHQTHHRLHNN